MTLKVVSSSSKGNCYLLQSAGGDTLLVELGITAMDVKKALDYRIGGVVGAVVTHRHKDHALAVYDIMRMGIPVLAPADVLATSTSVATLAVTAEHGRHYQLGAFKVTALNAYHDVPCLAYIIEHQEMGKVLFATDTFKLPYRVKDVTHLMIECNYMDEVLAFNEQEGYTPPGLRDRLMLTHMELNTTVKVVRQNLCDILQDVTLLHLSHDNSDADQMREAVEATGIPCRVASPGLVIDYNINPY